VFIGQDLDQQALTKALDDAILNDKEWAKWEKVGTCTLRSSTTIYLTVFCQCQIMKSKKSQEEKANKLNDVFDGEAVSAID
jgi:hypothetical protein